uniref:Uncharacterized protein LOC105138933 isoform X2 n=1 Tax=Rhizophora mucronata TaxID=61149 RepID=A0A2P2LH90_RHIMU
MARGLIQTAKGRVAAMASFVSRVTLSCEKLTLASYHQYRGPCRLSVAFPQPDSSRRLFCSKGCCVVRQDAVDMANYKEAFFRRMAMAGLKSHHRIGQ